VDHNSSELGMGDNTFFLEAFWIMTVTDTWRRVSDA
jgi:hypothetical protein